MSDETTTHETTAAPPAGALVTPEAPTGPERLNAAKRAGQAAAKAFTAADVSPVAPVVEPEVEAEAAEPEAPATEPELALAVKIKQREQRIREQAASKYAERERALNAREAQIQQQAARYSSLEELAKTNPAKLFAELGFQEKDYVKQRLEEGKPEAQITQMMRAFEEEKQARQRLEQQIQNAAAQEDRHKQEASFEAMAMDATRFPTVSAVYADAGRELRQEAYRVQAMFVEQHGRTPDLEEIAINLEAIEKAKAVRYARLNGTPLPVPATKKAPKAVPADTSGRDQSDRVLSPAEKRARAVAAGKRAFVNFK